MTFTNMYWFIELRPADDLYHHLATSVAPSTPTKDFMTTPSPSYWWPGANFWITTSL